MTLRQAHFSWARCVTERLTQTFQRVFAPSGNLLVTDLAAEVVVHVLTNGTRKTLVTKLDDMQAAHHAVQGLVMGAIEIGQQHGISINWVHMNALAPYQGEIACVICAKPITPNEPAVWVRIPPKIGHLRCVVVVEDK